MRILLIDMGCKESIFRSLVKRGAQVLRMHWEQQWERYLPEMQGIVLSSGPGDPRDYMPLCERLQPLLKEERPILGICLGHQMIMLSSHGTTSKLRYGHRSVNQPVKDLQTGRCYMTSQNHGYVVEGNSLPKGFLPWFVNLNDGTNEGVYHETLPIRGVQFHPEASPGPQDTEFIFDDFVHTVHFYNVNKRGIHAAFGYETA